MAVNAPLLPNARATYRIRAVDVSKVLCHRERNGQEEYLVRWKALKEPPVPPRAICSWHPLKELTLCLHYVQSYIEQLRGQSETIADGGSITISGAEHLSPNELPNRKRKAPGSSAPLSNGDSGSLTPQDSAQFSREPSLGIISSSDASGPTRQPTEVYNGFLQKREGKIIAKKSKDPNITKIVNSTKLPTPEMREAASLAPVSTAERFIREAFLQKLRTVPKVKLENHVDTSTPSLDFTFIREFELRHGVQRAPAEVNLGCQRPCRPNMGQYMGCEYTKLCGCLEYAAVDEGALESKDANGYQAYVHAKQNGYVIDTTGMPKRFPYRKSKVGDEKVPSTLQPFYLEERHPIYECNSNCNCGPVCKSRVVQKGRKVPLVIFKTPNNRGWGVYCAEDLIRGEFIDTYLGEVITNEEADGRESKTGKDKASYLYNLDKFVGDDDTLTEENCYVVDGQYMGGVTRFINHSCEPNCRQYTVSYNKHDLRIYDLAFFAYQDIPAGTELTFDYMDKDEEEEEDVLRQREEAANDPQNEDKKPCNCGARKCRGYLWV
ncbi:SET domain-containing protein [Hortaea werneckii]|nr:SET domain-containing protein [Hortaea werneckii]